jgi:hypothetical protein
MRTAALASTAILLLGCTGQIRGSAEGEGERAGGSGAASGTGGPAVPASDPGRVTLHRLNRAEYDNTVRDLLGTTQKASSDFPIDDRGSGFDNMADVLSLSPLHLSTYHAAAESLVAEAFADAAQRAAILICDPASGGDACAREILTKFAYRAWRRPLAAEEIERLMGPVALALAEGDGYELGLSLSLRAVLLSPHFIFRVELDADPTSLTPHPLSPFELASRLSYFLWSSMPDEDLLASAESGALSDPVTLAAEARRLLLDPRASALIENFAGQWLHLRAIDDLAPDPLAFPSFDEPLRAALKLEAELSFREVAFAAQPATSLLTADFTFLNDRLAAHYGLPAPGSSEHLRVSLAGNTQRGGLLAQGGFLALTSHPNRTSPVRRGKWILDELLCTVVPPPPPDVDVGAAAAAVERGLSQREALEQHRRDPACASCHVLMDPIGLGLENYDAVGAYRTMDAATPIDAAGELPSGETFSGSRELAAIIAAQPEFARCIVQKLYTYALGRPPSSESGHLDPSTLEAISARFVERGYAFEDLVLSIASAPTFLQRRGDATAQVEP